MTDGILCIRKEKGLTSNDVVLQARKILGVKKIGHAGTLDPDAQGLLLLCIGRATKLIQYLQEEPKTYIAEWTGGISTDTEDASGKVIEKVEGIKLSEPQVRGAFTSFIGTYEQKPPMYSAVKVGGKRLYEIARRGGEVERKPRRVTLYDLTLLEMNLGNDPPRVLFRVVSSKGTYIRTLCVDIGKRLGIPAHMSSLERTASGGFTLERSYTLKEVEERVKKGELQSLLIPMEEALPSLPKLVVDEAWERRILSGTPLPSGFPHPPLETGKRIRLFSQKGMLLAIYKVENDHNEARFAHPEKIIRIEDKVG